MLHNINNSSEFRNAIASNDKVIVDFSATWAGPCRLINPGYEAISDKVAGIFFAKADVDEAKDVTTENHIAQMPTFVAYVGGKELLTSQIARFSGASDQRLQHFVAKVLAA